ncbi:MAG: hypothetical protein IT186_25570 [Acidobacteria bacterium]|nr:hypothetical protein [Acidobacteriota bacterium]MCG3191583.1 hypothetical protein [Thermoanaerobaculia bacterium]
MKRALAALVLVICTLPGLSLAQGGAWKPLQEFAFLNGAWSGTTEASGRVGGVAASWTPEANGSVLVYRSKTIFPAVEGRPEETASEVGFFAYDGEKRKYTGAVFYSTSVWGLYDIEIAPDGTIKMNSTQLVNYSAGAKSRVTISKGAANEVNLNFEIAPQGTSFVPFSAAKLTKK